MQNRDESLLTIRVDSFGHADENSSLEELFQNKTLRPILKFQSDLFNLVFIEYATKQKNIYFGLSSKDKMTYIENVVKSDSTLRNTLKGIVIGLFTIEEYNVYSRNSSNLSKRINSMLIERLKSQVVVLEKRV